MRTPPVNHEACGHRANWGVASASMVEAALVCTVGAESALVLGGSRFVGLPGLLLVLLASAAWALVASDDRRVELRPHLVVLAIGVAFAIAIAVPPRNSHDLWSYVMYGRTVAVHHASPYLHPPSAYPHDPFFARVGRGWRDAKSVYGPLFTGVSAGLTRLGGDSALRRPARIPRACPRSASVAALVLIWRTTRSARAVAFLGLHPGGGHRDRERRAQRRRSSGSRCSRGALLAARRRWYGAGFVLGLGMLVKASAGLGLLAIAVWSFRRDRRGAVQLAARGRHDRDRRVSPGRYRGGAHGGPRRQQRLHPRVAAGIRSRPSRT